MPSFGGPERVLKYLARSTHRVAISNRRLFALKDGRVRFRYKDYARGGRRRAMTLEASEFLRRFLQHVLPPGFVRIRSYGFLANRGRREKLASCRNLLDASSVPDPGLPCHPVSLVVGIVPAPGITRCPACGVGRMVIVAEIPPTRNSRRDGRCTGPRPVFDTS